VFISGDFKSNDFVAADSRGFTGAFFRCAHSKGLAGVDPSRSLCGGFVDSAAIDCKAAVGVNLGKSVAGQETVVETRQSVTM
jgi:hypothetical protein